MCDDCLINTFKGSLKGNLRFPPKCCDEPVILTRRVKETLGDELLSRFHEREEELRQDQTDAKRTYCYVPTCSALIWQKDYVR